MKSYLLRLVKVILLATVLNILIEIFIHFSGNSALSAIRVATTTVLAMCMLDISSLAKRVEVLDEPKVTNIHNGK